MSKISITKLDNRQITAGHWTAGIAGAWWQVDYPAAHIPLLNKYLAERWGIIKYNVIIKHKGTILFPTFESATNFVSGSFAYGVSGL